LIFLKNLLLLKQRSSKIQQNATRLLLNQFMNKIIIILLIATIGFGAVALPALAQEGSEAAENQVENPGILSTSPFYFLKEWRRDLIKLFTFQAVKKAELELEEIDERAAEIKKLAETIPQNISTIGKALEKYQQNIERLKKRLKGLKETSQNPNIGKLLEGLIDKSLRHEELFEELKLKFQEQQELKEKLNINQKRIKELITIVPQRFEAVEAVAQRLEAQIKNRLEAKTRNGTEELLKNLRLSEIIKSIKEELPEAKQEAFDKIQERLQERLRERLETGIEKLENRELRREDIERMIAEAKNLIAEAEKKLENAKIESNQSVKQLLENAKSLLAKAEKSLTEEKLGEALGQTNAAISNAKNVLRQIYQKDNKEKICIQAITPAISPEGVCKEFSTPCDVPSGWKKVVRCPAVESSGQQ